MPNAILYYPLIDISNGSWLRQALLYWDQIASIVPRELDHPGNLSPDIRILQGAGVYAPFYPDDFFVRDERIRREFELEYSSITKKPSFWNTLPNPELRRYTAPIHIAKITDALIDYLLRNKLAIRRNGYENWFYFERSAGLLYMSLLAKYMADQSETLVIPGTDFNLYKDFVFNTENDEFSSSSLGLTLQDILPAPSEGTPIENILKFREKRHDLLINFREIIWEIQANLKNVHDNGEIKAVVDRYKDLINSRMAEISQTMLEEKLSIIRGSLETLIKTDLIPAVGCIYDPLQIPVEYKLGGLAVMGTISVSNYLLDRRNEHRRIIRENSFSYLYLAKQEGIL